MARENEHRTRICCISMTIERIFSITDLSRLAAQVISEMLPYSPSEVGLEKTMYCLKVPLVKS